MRQQMADAAVRLTRAIGYRGAGTIEFIVDVSDSPRSDRFWFLEMNIRLQVEHPVTEAITGLDLVEWQIRIAAGEPLPLAQGDVHQNGHAIEIRICAEDPARRDLPSPGTLQCFDLPHGSEGIRLDTGVQAGDVVSPYYDSLLAKLIVHASTRELALSRLIAALGQGQITGVANNVRFMKAACAHAAFHAGDIDTGFLDRYRTELLATANKNEGVQ
jgi:3-methylcrotonyl-CoA carboxylase alpha subunit